MKSIACLVIAVVLVNPVSNAAESRDAVRDFPDSLVQCELLRSPPAAHGRTTIRLYVRPLSDKLSISARCHLWKDGQDLGRFPLQQIDKDPEHVKSAKDDGRILFRIECLAEEFTSESRIQLRIIDTSNQKILPGVPLKLKDCAVWKPEKESDSPPDAEP